MQLHMLTTSALPHPQPRASSKKADDDWYRDEYGPSREPNGLKGFARGFGAGMIYNVLPFAGIPVAVGGVIGDCFGHGYLGLAIGGLALPVGIGLYEALRQVPK